MDKIQKASVVAVFCAIFFLMAIMVASSNSKVLANERKDANPTNYTQVTPNTIGCKFKGLDGCDMVEYVYTDPTTNEKTITICHSNICKQCFAFD